jgi:hypothetical protein
MTVNSNTKGIFGGFDFGPAGSGYKISHLGIAVRNAEGVMVSYDKAKNEVVNVEVLNFEGRNLVYKMPAAIKDVKAGDALIHNGNVVFVTSTANDITAIDVKAGEKKIILPTKSMFGFDFVTKVVNLFGNCFNSASEDQPFGNMLPLMLLADGGKADDMLPLMFAMGGGKFDMNNPMVLYSLVKDNGNKDVLPLLFLANGQGMAFGKHECKCEGCSR